MDQWRDTEEQERQRLLKSSQLLPQVNVSDEILELITDICAEYQVDGMRGDIVMYKTAGTIAAYENRTEVIAEDVAEAARLALLHRQRRQPFQQPHLATEQLDSMVQDFQNQQHPREPSDRDSGESQGAPEDSDEGGPHDSELDTSVSTTGEHDAGLPGVQDEEFEVGESFQVVSIEIEPPDKKPRTGSGRRSKTVAGSSAGRYVGAAAPQGPASDLALDLTLRVAAPHQVARRSATENDEGGFPPQPALLIEPWDIREKVRETKTGTLILFVVDASGSMAAQRRMVAVKGAVHSLLIDAYQRRDRVGLISFRGTQAELLLPPTGSVELAQSHLAVMPTGGRTPLAQGLYLALQVLETERLKDREVVPLVVLLSDGRANVPMGWTQDEPDPGVAVGEEGPASTDAKNMASLFKEQRIHSVVVDTEVGVLRFGMAQPIATVMGAQYIKLDDLHAESLAQAVRLRLPSVGGNA